MEDQRQQGEYLAIPGATTVGIVFKDGVVLASEKRISYGNLIVSHSGKKVFKITDHIGAACAGLVSDMQILVREVQAYVNLFNLDTNRTISVKSVSKLISNMLFNRRLAPLITQTIVGGVDEDGPSLYVLDIIGSLIPEKYTVVGSGMEIAIGVIEEAYKDNFTVDEAKELAIRAVKSGVSRDIMSGDGIDLLVLTKHETKEESIKL